MSHCHSYITLPDLGPSFGARLTEGYYASYLRGLHTVGVSAMLVTAVLNDCCYLLCNDWKLSAALPAQQAYGKR